MIDQVIVPLDGSENADRALRPAIEVARRFGVGTVLLRAIHPDDVDIARIELAQRIDDHQPPNPELVVDTMNGPVGAIVSLATDRSNALVCMTTHGRSGISRALLGSVAEETLREIDAPVLLVGPSHEPGAGIGTCVIVPVDGSHRSEAVLPLAQQWAAKLGVPLWIVTVIDPADAERMSAEGGDVMEDAYVRRVAESLPPSEVQVGWDVLHNADPALAIAEYVASRSGGLVVMATHGRSGLARVAMGSVSAGVVRDHSGLTLVSRSTDLEDSDL